MLRLLFLLRALGGAHVEPKAGIVDSAGVLLAFLCARIKATCRKEGSRRAPDGSGKPRRGGQSLLRAEVWNPTSAGEAQLTILQLAYCVSLLSAGLSNQCRSPGAGATEGWGVFFFNNI